MMFPECDKEGPMPKMLEKEEADRDPKSGNGYCVPHFGTGGTDEG